MPTEKEITVSGEKALAIADVVNATNLKILKLVRKEPLFISTIAKRLDFSEAFVSECVRALEDLKLVSINYERGERGIRKFCSSAVEKITIILKDEELQSSNFTEEKKIE